MTRNSRQYSYAGFLVGNICACAHQRRRGFMGVHGNLGVRNVGMFIVAWTQLHLHKNRTLNKLVMCTWKLGNLDVKNFEWTGPKAIPYSTNKHPTKTKTSFAFVFVISTALYKENDRQKRRTFSSVHHNNP
jgi:hypothetical protein